MPTIVEKTIGTGGDYADIAAWWAATPANFVTADTIQRGLLLNQKHTGGQTLSGKTTSATCYAEITTAPGASFADNADVSSNPLRYDATKGAAIEVTGNSVVGLTIQQDWTRFSKIQFASTSTGANAAPALRVTGANCTGKTWIAEASANNSALPSAVAITGANCQVDDFIVIQRRNDVTAIILALFTGSKATNFTLVSTVARLNYAIKTQNATCTIADGYIGNCTAPEDGVVPLTKTNCYTDATASGYSVAPYSTATFESITDGSHDFRIKNGSTLAGSGAGWEFPNSNSPPADTTAPNLSNPTASANGANAGNGSVTTNEANGTLYYLVSTATSATTAQVKAGSSKPVTATGAQSASASGLQAATTYRFHFLHRDAAGNDSSVVSSAPFTTATGGDTTAPVLEAPTATATGTTTASGTVATDEAGGLLYRFASTAATGVTAAQIKAANLAQTVEATGTQNVTFTALASDTTYYAYYLQRDGAGNESAIVRSQSFRTQAAAVGAFKTQRLVNNAGTLIPQGTAVVGQWHQGGRVGSPPSSVAYVSSTVGPDNTANFTGLPTGPGYLLMAIRGAALADDQPYYEPGQVA